MEQRLEHDGRNKFQRSITSIKENALRASYLLANRITKAKKPFTIGEELIFPTTTDVCREILGDPAAQEIAHVPLSASTEEIAEDIDTQLLQRINALQWHALHVDESTDIDNKAILLVYMRCLYQKDAHEDLVCALCLPTNTTGREIFKSLDGCISGQLKWSFCVGICTAMMGRWSG